jgi:glycerol-3-phosphate responsive antiterminator
MKSLLPYIAKEMAMAGVVTTEEAAIVRAHELDLIYS